MIAARAFGATLATVALCGALACENTKSAGTGLTDKTKSVRFDQDLPAGKGAPPGGDSRNPYAGSARSAREGERLFNAMNCDGCHGGGAVGWVGPSLVDGRWRYGGSDSAIFRSIRSGRPNGMPAFEEILTPEITWKLVTYLRSLPVPGTVPTESW